MEISANDIMKIKATAAEIINGDAETIKERTKAWLLSELPDLTSESADELVETITNVSTEFRNKVDNADSNETIRDELKEMLKKNIENLSETDAIRYLVSLKIAVNMTAPGSLDEMLEDYDAYCRNITAQVEDTAAGYAYSDVGILIAEIVASESASSVLKMGNGEIVQKLITDNVETLKQHADGIYADASERAAIAAVIYAKAKKGEITGVPTELDAGTLAVYVNAALERAEIVDRLANGEITEDEADSKLELVGHVVKIILGTALLMVTSLAVGGTIAVILPIIIGTSTFATAITAIAVVVGIAIHTTISEDAIYDFADWFCTTVYKAAVSACNWVKSGVKRVFA
jgi:hypothetical protein